MDNKNFNVIAVEGVGRVKVMPDMTSIKFSIEKIDTTYEKAQKQAANAVQGLNQAIVDCGFKKEDIKTSNLQASQIKEYGQNDIKKIAKIKGYRFTQNITLTFALNVEKISEVLNAVAESKVEPSIAVDFYLKEKEQAHKQALKLAVKNATTDAEVLAESAGIKLGKIFNINYYNQSYEMAGVARSYSVSMCRNDSVAESVNELEITPTEITVERKVSLSFEI